MSVARYFNLFFTKRVRDPKIPPTKIPPTKIPPSENSTQRKLG